MNTYNIKRFTKFNNSLTLNPTSRKYFLNYCKDRITDENPTTNGWTAFLDVIKTLKIKNDDDKSRVFLSLLDKHENVVVKIGDSDKIEHEYKIGLILDEFDGFVKFLCFFTCDDDYLSVEKTLCKGPGNVMKIIIMPYFEMGSLISHKLSNINQLRSVLKQIFLTIMEANRKIGFIHGDLHPGNIVLKKTKSSSTIYDLCELGFHIIPTYGIRSLIMDFEGSDIESNNDAFSEAMYIQKIDTDFEKLFTILKVNERINKLTLAPIIIFINEHIMKSRRLNTMDIRRFLELIDDITFID